MVGVLIAAASTVHVACMFAVQALTSQLPVAARQRDSHDSGENLLTSNEENTESAGWMSLVGAEGTSTVLMHGNSAARREGLGGFK